MTTSRENHPVRQGVAAGASFSAAILLLADLFGTTSAHEPSTAVSWVKIVLGVLLVVFAGMQWRNRTDTTPPGWMRALDGLGTVRAVGLGTVLAVLNPKNLLLCVSAGMVIGGTDLAGGGKVGAVVVFTVLAAASVLAVVGGYVSEANRLRGVLDDAREWLQRNTHQVLAIVLVVMGAVVLGKGIGGL